MATLHASSSIYDRIERFFGRFTPNDEQFEAMCKQAEREFIENPGLYKIKAITLALFGYSAIALGFVSLLALLYFGVQLAMHSKGGTFFLSAKFLIVIFAAVAVLVKSLWIKSEAPKGLPIKREDAPELYKMVDEIADKLNTRVDHILLDGNFNAYVTQKAVAEWLGIYENYMVLGLPLMLAASPSQYKAILAHELGHLSGNHSKSKAWLYNMRIRLGQIMESSKESAFFVFWYTFFYLFAPHFYAYTLAMARHHELQADKSAVEIAGVEPFSYGMMLLPVWEELYETSFWEDINKKMRTTETPPPDLYKQMQDRLFALHAEPEELNKILKRAFEVDAKGTDSHPPLKIRVLAGQFTPCVKLNAEGIPDKASMDALVLSMQKKESAAVAYLGNWLGEAQSALSKDWSESFAEQWKLNHDHLKSLDERLNEILDKESKEEQLALTDLQEKASLIHQLDGLDASQAAYRAIIALDPKDPYANYNLGMALLKKDLEDGLTYLRTAIGARKLLLSDAYEPMHSYFVKNNRPSDAELLKKELDDLQEEAKLAVKERESLNANSLMEAFECSEDLKNYLTEVFTSVPQVKEVYLARLITRYLPDCTYLILAIEMAGSDEDKLAFSQNVMGYLSMPHEFCVITFDITTLKMRNKLKDIPETLIYKKSK